MEIIKFKHISFEEWLKNGKDYWEKLGAYWYNIRNSGWVDGIPLYCFSFHIYSIYTDCIFSKVYHDYGDIEKLKEWYNETIDEFNIFWENFIKSTYIKEDNI